MAEYDQNYGGVVDWNAVRQAVSAELQFRREQERMEERAIQLQGMNKVRQLMDGGATQAEAILAASGDLYYNNPTGFGNALRQTIPKPVTPVRRQVMRGPDGALLEIPQTGPVVPLTDPKAPTPPRVSTAAPRMNQAAFYKAKKELDSAYKNLEEIAKLPEGGKSMNPFNKDVSKTEQKDAALAQAKARLAKANSAMDQLASGPANPKMIYEEEPVPDTSEKVVIIKDGKKFRLPKSQLAEAEQAGYKLVE